jgi:hypothetical protein
MRRQIDSWPVCVCEYVVVCLFVKQVACLSCFAFYGVELCLPFSSQTAFSAKTFTDAPKLCTDAWQMLLESPGDLTPLQQHETSVMNLYANYSHFPAQVDESVMFRTCICDVFSSNTCRATGQHEFLRSFSQSLKESCGIVLQLGHYIFLPHPCHSLIFIPLDAVALQSTQPLTEISKLK